MKHLYCNRAGFTLLELLIAAAIIGILALFATVSYRNSTAQTRVAQARAVTQSLAMGNYRAHIDYPNISFDSNPIRDVVQGTTGTSFVDGTSVCARGFASNPSSAQPWQASCLVANGYVDALGFEGYFHFTVSGEASACFEGVNSKLGKYQGYKACYNAANDSWSEISSTWSGTGGTTGA